MAIKHSRFPGGYQFRSYRGQPVDELLVFPIPDKVLIPLKQGFGNELPPLVGEGEGVSAGQIIARDDSIVSSPIHATVNGVMECISRINYFKQEITAVRIRSDGTNDWQPIPGHSADWKNLPVEAVLYLCGPPPMIDAAIKVLTQKGMSQDNLYYDKF